VFHQGHHPWHGITVLLETTGAHTYVGRFDTQDDAGLHLLDVAVHDGGNPALSKDEFIRRTVKFGVRVERKHLLVPSHEVARVAPLNTVGG
jgi:hypothetical protein